MLNKKEFDILRYIAENRGILTQRLISEETGYSLGTVNAVISTLIKNNLLETGTEITVKGYEELKPYRVDNAIILAAGMSTRFVPFSYEKPKGLTVVKGEVLIERQIKQLQEAGIKEIVLVLGHMMEKFLYLMEKYNVKIVVNNEYRYKNTHSSVYVARDYLKNTYICCADNYFTSNVFHTYEYHSLYSTLFMEGTWRGERGVLTDKDGLIIKTQRPAVDQWVMNGYAFFDREFSCAFKKILEDVYNTPGTENLYWEQVYAEHVDELKLYEKRCSDDLVLEFDSVAELEKFDQDYIKYNDLQLTRNICRTLKCTSSDIHAIKPMAKGFTNKSFSFLCRDEKYVYREPGRISREFIDRRCEKKALEIAKLLQIDLSYVYEDDKDGWKISHFIDKKEEFSFANPKHLKMLCDTLRKMYEKPITCGKLYDYLYAAKEFLNKLKTIDSDTYMAAVKYLPDIEKVDREIKADGWPLQLTHNDIYEDNLIITSERLYLIDWEFAGDTDIGFDLCKLFVKNEADLDQIDDFLFYYYERKPTEAEKIHIIGCAVVSFYHWYIWALYMVKMGNDYSNLVFDYLNIMKKYLSEYKEMRGDH